MPVFPSNKEIPAIILRSQSFEKTGTCDESVSRAEYGSSRDRLSRNDNRMMKTWIQTKFFHVALLVCVFLLPTDVWADSIDYDTDVRPILESHCIKCHGDKVQKGDLRLDTLSPDFLKDRRAAERWHDVRDALNQGHCPTGNRKFV